jgi:hypothetical protein
LEQIRKENTCISICQQSEKIASPLIPRDYFQTLLDAKEKLKIMFKEGDNTIKVCGMDQLDAKWGGIMMFKANLLFCPSHPTIWSCHKRLLL